MIQTARLTLQEIETRICDIASEQMGISRAEVFPSLRVIQDLHWDSLGLLDFFMRIEMSFDVALPSVAPNNIYKSVFTRDPFRLSDLAELVYLQQGSGRVRLSGVRNILKRSIPSRIVAPFAQLGGRISLDEHRAGSLHDSLGNNEQGLAIYRRRTDGMVCIRVPRAQVELGTDDVDALSDERPTHLVRLDEFLIDQEPVSTSAYCRFLNSVGPVEQAILDEWFVLSPNDQRREHVLLRQTPDGWSPLPGTERMPMMLVSWYGANAYSLWANRRDWRVYRLEENDGDESFLPSEAQWEYAARGDDGRRYPWGDEEPTSDRMRFAQHAPGCSYRAETLPLAETNADLGISPFGLRHMAGNIWQWCRDWYSPTFYASPESSTPNPVNREPSCIRSERGGSWIGPAFLCRSTYRRGRVPTARGRCLGFRCVGELMDWH